MNLVPFVSTHFIPLNREVDVTCGKIYKIIKWKEVCMNQRTYIEFEFVDDKKDIRKWDTLLWNVVDASYEANLEKILEWN